jgi:hypothetical protein
LHYISGFFLDYVSASLSQDARPKFSARPVFSSYDQMWHYAYSQGMKATGPEFRFVGSLKLHTAGERLVYIVPYDELRAHFQKQMPAAHIPSLANVQNYLQEATLERADALASKAHLYRVKVKANEMLYTPSGYIQCEMTVGSDDVFGYRWMVAPPNVAGLAMSAFCNMQATMKPAPGAQVPGNLALLMATHEALFVPGQ